MTASFHVGCQTNVLCEVCRRWSIEAAVCQNAETECYPFRNPQPVKLAEKRSDALRTPDGEYKISRDVCRQSSICRLLTAELDFFYFQAGRAHSYVNTVPPSAKDTKCNVWRISRKERKISHGVGVKPILWDHFSNIFTTLFCRWI